jgi:hypothetical protein
MVAGDDVFMPIDSSVQRKTTVLEGGQSLPLREPQALTKEHKRLRGVDSRSWSGRARRVFVAFQVSHFYDGGVGQRRDARGVCSIH